VAFVELLGLVCAFFSIYVIIWLFVLICRTFCEMLMMGMIDPSSISTLTCFKLLAMMFKSIVPLYPNASSPNQ
jgi:hypothetical protein